MYADQVKNLKWVPVKNWEQLTHEKVVGSTNYIVGKADVENFVENIFKEVSQQLNIPYSELKPILVEENLSFFATKNILFDMYKIGLSKDNPFLTDLQEMLRIPDTSSILNPNVENS